MTPKLVKAQYIGEYKIRLWFEDGKSGVLDLAGELWGEVFEPLQSLSNFQRFSIDQELQTIVWSNGADLAPEYIYERAVA